MALFSRLTESPELVRKEIWTHVLAYNLIRTIIAQSAIKHGMQPRTLSFETKMEMLKGVSDNQVPFVGGPQSQERRHPDG